MGERQELAQVNNKGWGMHITGTRDGGFRPKFRGRDELQLNYGKVLWLQTKWLQRLSGLLTPQVKITSQRPFG